MNSYHVAQISDFSHLIQTTARPLSCICYRPAAAATKLNELSNVPNLLRSNALAES